MINEMRRNGELISVRRLTKAMSKEDRLTSEQLNKIIAERLKETDKQDESAEKREAPEDKTGKEFKSGQDSNILAVNSPALSEASTCIIDTTAKDDSNRTEKDKLLYQSTTERLIMGKYDTFDRIYKYADNKHMGFEIWLRRAPSEIKSRDMLHSILDSLKYVTDLNLLAG